MRFLATYNTDIGISKKTNQDSLAIKVIENKEQQAAMAVVCDGMGGLAEGETASRELILAFATWFDDVFIKDVENNCFDEGKLLSEWDAIIQNMNQSLAIYGQERCIKLGTTVSAILCFRDNFYIVHVGDSRIYQLSDVSVQLTEDHTFIAREMAAGRMTEEQAKKDPRKSALLQCVGASPVVCPDFMKGTLERNAVYMVCSDGFRHYLSDEELLKYIGPAACTDEDAMKHGCVYLTEVVKNRREKDNISVAVIRTYD